MSVPKCPVNLLDLVGRNWVPSPNFIEGGTIEKAFDFWGTLRSENS